MIDIGFDQYDVAIQQILQLEILNHEDSNVQIVKTHQAYGNCGQSEKHTDDVDMVWNLFFTNATGSISISLEKSLIES